LATVRVLLLLAAAATAGCALLPEMPHVSADGRAREVRIAGAGGRLPRAESDAILQKLRAAGRDLDILERHIALEEAMVGAPLVAGNRVSLLEDGPATYKAMFAAITAARSHINLETYIFEDDEVGRRFAALLLAKQAQGVQVNLIYDSAGAFGTPKSFFDRLREGGIRVLEFNPVNPLRARTDWLPNYRDHRKLLVVDGRIAFLGGINISDVYASGSSAPGSRPNAKEAWRDTHARIEGPVVAEFQKLFIETWTKQKGEPLDARSYFPRLEKRGDDVVRAVGGAADEAYSEIYVTLVSALQNAERSAHITMAYFIPDPQLLAALAGAARRGVDVKLILPSFSDSWPVFHAGRSHYKALLQAGVKIHERQEALLHAKTVVIDGVWSTVGSTNMDPRSFVHNDEVNAVVLGRPFAQQLSAMFERDLARSAPVTLDTWRRRPATVRMKEWLARWWRYWL
jgi:cardiolipin synthase A/B